MGALHCRAAARSWMLAGFQRAVELRTTGGAAVLRINKSCYSLRVLCGLLFPIETDTKRICSRERTDGLVRSFAPTSMCVPGSSAGKRDGRSRPGECA